MRRVVIPALAEESERLERVGRNGRAEIIASNGGIETIGRWRCDEAHREYVVVRLLTALSRCIDG